MPSLLPGYQYDIFISYRQNDNKRDGWVSEFVEALQDELDATVKEKISIYFDENPYDGLGESHDVDDSLAKKLKCLIFIPIISKTYCDPGSFAWTNEFLAFKKQAEADEYGIKVNLPNGNTASRILPIRIHDIDEDDKQLIENEIGFLRSIDFVYSSSGVNRPLRSHEDDPSANLNKTYYRDQINKVANAVQQITQGIKLAKATEDAAKEESKNPKSEKIEIPGELKRRSVLRVSLVYILIALALWKIGGIIGLQENTQRLIPLILIALFPISILMAWLFERSPQGFIRVGSEASKKNPFKDNQKKPLTSNTFIAILLISVIGLFIIYPQNQINTLLDSNVTMASKNKSIAVLYFDNLSGDPEEDYFSDGITEEIISRLAKIKELKVISRNSVKVYKGQTVNTKKIAEELGVSAILEGSVRKSGNQYRITAQLIDAETDQHIWSDDFNRESSNIIQIQIDIAHAIANKFEVELTPEVDIKVSKIPTADEKAYDLYSKARYYLYSIGDLGATDMAIQNFEEAIKLDSLFADAYAGLAEAYDHKRNIIRADFPSEHYDLKRKYADKALSLDPESSYAHQAKVWELIHRIRPVSDSSAFFRNFDSAFYHAKRALMLNPNDPLNLHFFGGIFYSGPDIGIRLYNVAIPFFEKANELDPNNSNIYTRLSIAYRYLGDENSARENMFKALELESYDFYLAGSLVSSLLYFDQFEEAKRRLQLMSGGTGDYWWSCYYAATGQEEKVDERFRNDDQVLLYSGKIDEYLKSKDNSMNSRGSNSYLQLLNDKRLNGYRNNPEYLRVLAKAKALHEAYMQKYGNVKLSDFK